MNPSLSLRTNKQLYDRLKKRHEESGFLDVLNELSENGEAGFVISLGDEADWNRWVEKTFFGSNPSGVDSSELTPRNSIELTPSD